LFPHSLCHRITLSLVLLGQRPDSAFAIPDAPPSNMLDFEYRSSASGGWTYRSSRSSSSCCPCCTTPVPPADQAREEMRLSAVSPPNTSTGTTTTKWSCRAPSPPRWCPRRHRPPNGVDVVVDYASRPRRVAAAANDHDVVMPILPQRCRGRHRRGGRRGQRPRPRRRRARRLS